MITMAETQMLRTTLIVLCFAIVAQAQCLAQCLALPCEETHTSHEGAEHTSSARTSHGNCHDEAPEPAENEDCGSHASFRMVSASRVEKVAAKASMLAVALAGLPMETNIPSYGVPRQEPASLTNPLLAYVRSTVLLI